MTKLRLIGVQALMTCALLLASCGGGEGEATPTLNADDIQTLAIETFSAALTQTALAAPSNTPLPTLTASPTSAPFVTSTGGAGLPGAPSPIAGTASCYRLAFVSDVSIPDNTPMAPGQTFTKTWKVSNTGSCAWDAGFKFAFTSGEAMNGATYTLPSAVPTNAVIDISIAMTAPTNRTGPIRGNWRMSTAGGQYFGDEIYVLIVVGGATGTPPTATNTGAPATATLTPTETPKPPTPSTP